MQYNNGDKSIALATTATAATFNINRVIGGGTVTGYVETDGTLGSLTAGNIVDWMITLISPNMNGGTPDTFGFVARRRNV